MKKYFKNLFIYLKLFLFFDFYYFFVNYLDIFNLLIANQNLTDKISELKKEHISPLEHFELFYYSSLRSFSFSLLNDSIFYLSTIIFIFYIFFFLDFKIIKNIKIQFIIEELYVFILEIIKNQMISVRSLRYFNIFYIIFWVILILNILSLSFYNTSVTGHIMITFSYSFIFFTSLIIIGLLSNKLNFINLFIPKNVPKFLLLFLILIELLSFLIRPFSLSIRLFANMLAGHTLLTIFGSFGSFIFNNFKIFYLLPLLICFLITVLEFSVSIIQAYVFIVLLIIYLSDMILIKH